MKYPPTYHYNTIDELSVPHDFNTSGLTKTALPGTWIHLANKPLFSRSGFLFIMFTQYNLEIVQEEEFKKRVSVSVHLCSRTELLMLLLWALSSTLNITM